MLERRGPGNGARGATRPTLLCGGAGGEVFAVATVVEPKCLGFCVLRVFGDNDAAEGQMCRGLCPAGGCIFLFVRGFLLLVHDNVWSFLFANVKS